jgi:hypothetical protein
MPEKLGLSLPKRTYVKGVEGGLKRIFQPKGKEITGIGESNTVKNFIICTLHQI